MKTEREILEQLIDVARAQIFRATYASATDPPPHMVEIYRCALEGEEVAKIRLPEDLPSWLFSELSVIVRALRRLREIEAARVAEDIETLTKVDAMSMAGALARGRLDIPPVSESGEPIKRELRTYVRAWVDPEGFPRLTDERGSDHWTPFNPWKRQVDAEYARAYWRENYQFAVDETFDEATARVVKLPANQGRTPSGEVVTFVWEGVCAVVRGANRELLGNWPTDELLPAESPWRPLIDRLREWALANVPEGIEIVDGVPSYREAEPEAFFVDSAGARWHFVETPDGWGAMRIRHSGYAVAVATGESGPIPDALRAYLDARGVKWRKAGGTP